MAKIFGFGRKAEEEKKGETSVVVRAVEKEFQGMIRQLELEEEAYVHLLVLETRVRKELVKLYKLIKKLEKKVAKRNALLAQCRASAMDFPKKSLELLNSIEALDREIIPEAEEISKELSKHTLPDIAEFYKEMDLSNEQIKQVRGLANTLQVTLNTLVQPIYETVRNQQADSLRRDILMRNPSLK